MQQQQPLTQPPNGRQMAQMQQQSLTPGSPAHQNNNQMQPQMMPNHVTHMQTPGPQMGMMPPDTAGMMQMNANAAGMPGAPPYGYVNSLVPPPHYLPHPHVGQQSMQNKARIQCHACGKLLEYDAGAQYVQVSPLSHFPHQQS